MDPETGRFGVIEKPISLEIAGTCMLKTEGGEARWLVLRRNGFRQVSP